MTNVITPSVLNAASAWQKTCREKLSAVIFCFNALAGWGNNPVMRRHEEIDILALDDENVLICECKYTESHLM